MIHTLGLVILIIAAAIFLYALAMFDHFAGLCKIDERMPNLFTRINKNDNIEKREFYRKLMVVGLLGKVLAITLMLW